jgi:hypothetical protein
LSSQLPLSLFISSVLGASSLEKKVRLLYILKLTKREADENFPFEDSSLEVKKEKKDG